LGHTTGHKARLVQQGFERSEITGQFALFVKPELQICQQGNWAREAWRGLRGPFLARVFVQLVAQ
jgi:hypothetical protein